MATKLVRAPSQQVIRHSIIIPTTFRNMLLIRNRIHSPFSDKSKPQINTRFGFKTPIKVAADQISASVTIEDHSQIKAHLYEALKGINRGIFGIPTEKKCEIEGIVELLESQNPTPEPTQCLDKVGGRWRLLYSTVTILGSKRTKLGLRDFITLGDLFQTIHVAEGKAVNVITFNVRGLNLLNGQLQIEAIFNIASNSRVDINYKNSSITPAQLMNVFRKNYDLLLSIFNPEGWLEITYLDETLRIGRDDKGNIFILERPPKEEQVS